MDFVNASSEVAAASCAGWPVGGAAGCGDADEQYTERAIATMRADVRVIFSVSIRDLSGRAAAAAAPIALELQLIRHDARDSRCLAGDFAGTVDRIGAPHVATEMGDAVVDLYIDVTEVVDGVGIQLRIDDVRQDLIGWVEVGTDGLGGAAEHDTVSVDTAMTTAVHRRRTSIRSRAITASPVAL